MKHTVVRASGKLLLLGEYAVTEGAHALVVTVDRSARVEISPSEHAASLLLAPDIHSKPIPFSLNSEGVQWLAPRVESLDLVEAVMSTFMTTMKPSLPAPAIKLSLCTREFFDASGQFKLGLGSSAALTVALLRALYRYFIVSSKGLTHEQQFFQAIEAHQKFQSGLGSGVDIAASVAGGLLSFRWVADEHLHLQALSWPTELKLALVWTGKSASTRDMLRDLAAWKTAQPRQYAHELARLIDLSEAGANAFEAHRSEDFLEIVASFAGGLESLGEKSGIDIFSHEHRQLAHLAQQNDLVYKPSGAGGGDFGLALGLDDAAIKTFIGQCTAAGFDGPLIKTNP